MSDLPACATEFLNLINFTCIALFARKLMSRIKNIFLLFTSIFSLSACHLVSAQPQNFYFKNYGVKDGISYGVVNDIFRDSEGFLWLGTFNGLNRFDGTGFKVFYPNQNDSSAIIGSDVLRICEDREGNIFSLNVTITFKRMYKITEKFVLVRGFFLFSLLAFWSIS